MISDMIRLINILERQYGINCIDITAQEGGWSALAYKVSDGVKEYFLKVYEKSRVSTPKLTALIDTYVPIILWLNENTDMKAKLPVPLLTQDGKNKWEDDNGVYLLYEYIDGITIGSSELTENQVQQVGKIIATLHSYKDEIPVNTKDIREEFSLSFLNQLKEILHKEFAGFPVDLTDLLGAYIKTLERYIDRVERLAIDIRRSNPKMVLCHTDIHNWNLMQSDEQIVLIDWEGLKLAPAEADLMFFVDKPYYDIFIDIYQKLHKDFVINMDTLLFYRIRRKLEDIFEFIEQLLYNKQEEQERNETIKLLMRELNDLVFWRSILVGLRGVRY